MICLDKSIRNLFYIGQRSCKFSKSATRLTAKNRLILVKSPRRNFLSTPSRREYSVFSGMGGIMSKILARSSSQAENGKEQNRDSKRVKTDEQAQPQKENAQVEKPTETVSGPEAVNGEERKLLRTIDYLAGSRLYLAPMVRIGTLPTRLLSLNYGASLVWGPEIVDKALLHTTRVEVGDEAKGTKLVKFVCSMGKLVFETHQVEKSRLIFQLGSADPETAVQAAKMVMNDVSGIDLNCGCPKPFSVKGGMGAALLSDPERLCSILRALVKEIPLPISCKIRLLETDEQTAELVKKIINTGISHLTIHGRTKNMRPREPALPERITKVVETVRRVEKEEGRTRKISLAANGDCWKESDSETILKITNVDAIMIARGAEADPTCFSKEPLPENEEDFAKKYVRLAKVVKNNFNNTKYVLAASSLFPNMKKKQRNVYREAMNRSKNYDELFKAMDIDQEPIANGDRQQVNVEKKEEGKEGEEEEGEGEEDNGVSKHQFDSTEDFLEMQRKQHYQEEDVDGILEVILKTCPNLKNL